MKIKSFITVLSLCVIFIFNAAFSLASAEGDNSHKERTANSNWLENHHRVTTKVKDSITVGLEGDVNTLGIGFFRVKANLTWVFVQCCKPTIKPDNWCNAGLQDKRC